MAEPGGPKSTTGGGLTQDAWLETLYRQHKAGLLRFVGGVLRDRTEADDVVQSTFAKAAESGGSVQPDAIKAWLYRVAFHEAVDRKRRRRVDRKARQALSDGPRRPSSTPDEKLVRDEVIDRVRQAMQELSAGQQQVARMRVYEEKTFAQIARETGMPLGTVLTHMRRALEKLRQKLPRKETNE